MEKRKAPLSKKVKAVHRYLSPEERIDQGASTEMLVEYLNRPGGAIWRIFWLHLQHHLRFPIYDQHVHRAMAYLLNHPDSKREAPAHNPAKIHAYLNEYRGFFARFDGHDPRQVDRALWSFGRFLGTPYARALKFPLANAVP
jgi:hypothetical protein